MDVTGEPFNTSSKRLSNIFSLLNPPNHDEHYPSFFVSPSPPRSPHRRNSGSSGVNGRGGISSGGGSPRRVLPSTTEGKGASNLPLVTSTSTTTTDPAALTTVETVPSPGSVVSITSHASASTTSIDSPSDQSDGGKSRSSSSCSSGLGSVWGMEDVIEDIRPKGTARYSNGEDDDDEEEEEESGLDDCGASVSTAGSTDDGCLDAFLVDTDSGSDTGEGMSDVSSISSHGLSHGSEVSQSMLRNVAVNTAFNKGFAQRRSVHDPLYHINPIIIPSPAQPSSPMQTTPSSPNGGGAGSNSTTNSVGQPSSIAINASVAMESTDMPRDDGESSGGIVLVGLGEKAMQDLRGSFKGREEQKSPPKRVW